MPSFDNEIPCVPADVLPQSLELAEFSPMAEPTFLWSDVDGSSFQQISSLVMMKLFTGGEMFLKFLMARSESVLCVN